MNRHTPIGSVDKRIPECVSSAITADDVILKVNPPAGALDELYHLRQRLGPVGEVRDPIPGDVAAPGGTIERSLNRPAVAR